MAPNEDSCCGIIADIADELVNNDDFVTSLIAETNAYGWGYDSYSGFSCTLDAKDASKATLEVTILLSGDQDEDAGELGDEIDVKVKAELNKDNDSWTYSSYDVVSADRND